MVNVTSATPGSAHSAFSADFFQDPKAFCVLISSSMPKRKATTGDTSATKKRRRTNTAEQVFAIPELFERIIRSVPRNDITLIQRVSRSFFNISKFGPIQEYLHHVPSNDKAGREILHFRKERISDFIQQVCLVPHLSLTPTHGSCIQGYGGEIFVDKDDKAYKRNNEMIDHILRNTKCAKPCLLKGDWTRTSCNLNPGPFKRIVCALLAAAWNANAKFAHPMQPNTYQITCDATLVQNIKWSKYAMNGKFGVPSPKNTFEATINWVFCDLFMYTEDRIQSFGYALVAGDKDCAKRMVLCQAKILKEFRVARSASWTLEQTCYIVDRIPEEFFRHCRDSCGESLG